MKRLKTIMSLYKISRHEISQIYMYRKLFSVCVWVRVSHSITATTVTCVVTWSRH